MGDGRARQLCVELGRLLARLSAACHWGRGRAERRPRSAPRTVLMPLTQHCGGAAADTGSTATTAGAAQGSVLSGLPSWKDKALRAIDCPSPHRSVGPDRQAQGQPRSSVPDCPLSGEPCAAVPAGPQAGSPQSSSESWRSCNSSSGPWASRRSSRRPRPACVSRPPSAGRDQGYINPTLSGRSQPWRLLITN